MQLLDYLNAIFENLLGDSVCGCARGLTKSECRDQRGLSRTSKSLLLSIHGRSFLVLQMAFPNISGLDMVRAAQFIMLSCRKVLRLQ